VQSTTTALDGFGWKGRADSANAQVADACLTLVDANQAPRLEMSSRGIYKVAQKVSLN